MPRSADVFMHGIYAGRLVEAGTRYTFAYAPVYAGPPVSLALPLRPTPYEFSAFPAFFDGLLPEGYALDALLRARKIDRNDPMGQLLAVGADLVGAVTVLPSEAAP